MDRHTNPNGAYWALEGLLQKHLWNSGPKSGPLLRTKERLFTSPQRAIVCVHLIRITQNEREGNPEENKHLAELLPFLCDASSLIILLAYLLALRPPIPLKAFPCRPAKRPQRPLRVNPYIELLEERTHCQMRPLRDVDALLSPHVCRAFKSEDSQSSVSQRSVGMKLTLDGAVCTQNSSSFSLLSCPQFEEGAHEREHGHRNLAQTGCLRQTIALSGQL